MADPHQTRSPNRLIHETSPYLLQHAYNPVGLVSRGQEALRLAKIGQTPAPVYRVFRLSLVSRHGAGIV